MAISYTRLDFNNNIFSPGAFLGSTASQDLIADLNSMSNGQFIFGTQLDPFRSSHNLFMENVVNKLEEVNTQIFEAGVAIKNPDYLRPITSIEELKEGVPPCMYQPILTFEPITTLFKNDLIQGFNIPKEKLEEDVFDPMIRNNEFFIIPDSREAGYVSEEYFIDEPDTEEYMELKQEVTDIVRDTRNFLTSFLRGERTKKLDPTSIPALDLRG